MTSTNGGEIVLTGVARPNRTITVSGGQETAFAVADGNAAAGGQKAVDGSHQTAEQGAGGQEADGCSLGHVCPLFLARNYSAW